MSDDDDNSSEEESSADAQAERQARVSDPANDLLAALSKSTASSETLLSLTAQTMMAQVAAIAGPKVGMYSAYLAAMETYSRALAKWPTLSHASDYAEPDPPESVYSSAMESAASYFVPWEVEINSFDALHREITRLIGKTSDLSLVWRGHRRSTWGLHSALFRHLTALNGVIPPEEKPTAKQRYPDETQMVEAEREILRVARDDWRFDNMSALETFARIQHAGGPTRLIDVTLNPYVAAWFAVEANLDDDDHDGRLFALATRPVEKEGKPPAGDSTVRLDDLGALHHPFWHLWNTPAERQQWDWGTGARRRLWVPPAYDPRISAQNAAFLLDGVPLTSQTTASYFTVAKNV